MLSFRCSLVLLASWIFFPVIAAADPIRVSPGNTAEGSLGGGQEQAIEVVLPARHHARVAVEQVDIDLELRLLAADGSTELVMENLGGPFGPEEVTLTSDQPTVRRLIIAPVYETAAAGRYRLQVVDLRPLRPGDEEIATAERSFAEVILMAVSRRPEQARQAIPRLEHLAKAFSATQRPLFEGRCYDTAGFAHWVLDRPSQAIALYERARQVFDAAGQEVFAADSINHMATAEHALGHWEKAASLLEAILPVYIRHQHREGEAASLASLSAIHEQLGRPQDALAASHRAIALAAAGSNRHVEATAQRNLGVLLRNLGDLDHARTAFDAALAIERDIGWRDGEAQSLAEIGALEHRRGNLETAISTLDQALKLARQADSRRVMLWTLHNLGNALGDAGETQQALDHLTEALQIGRERQDRSEADILLRMGSLETDRGRAAAARRHFKDALDRFRRLGHRDGESRALLALAEDLRRRGDLTSAHRQVESAITILDSTRRRLVRPDRRAAFAASKALAYELRVALRMEIHHQSPEAGWDRRAFEAHEAARARSLRETLVASRGGNAEEFAEGPRGDRLRRAIRELEALEAQRLRHRRQGAPETADLDHEIAAAVDRYRDLQAELRQQYRRVSLLDAPPPVTVEQLQEELLDDRTVVLEFALGEPVSYAWLIAKDRFESFRLPSRQQIEERAQELHGLLSRSHRRGVPAQAEISARRLSNDLLAPLQGGLDGHQRLVLVADGALAYIPFGLLTPPAEAGRPTALGERHEILAVPSLGVLRELRRPRSRRMGTRVAVIADPVFAPRDERVAQQNRESSSQEEPWRMASLERSSRDLDLDRLGRLPFSRREALAIAALLEKDERFLALDFDASLATVEAGLLRGHEIVHFATHTLVNSRHPELSGLVLSLVDPVGRPQAGFLRAHSIAELDLDAELVVLSGCQTALGKAVRGEGLLGLTRAFMHAGAPRVVVSLWDVSDEATAQLMTRFYRALLEERLPVAAALRQAQQEMRREKRWSAPYYWAGFVVQGDWQ
ncbi:MAG: CHAT domain-containing tetratricopeptide repeat protein [Acidobacteriota bacterium]